jgi:hypothetical protein
MKIYCGGKHVTNVMWIKCFEKQLEKMSDHINNLGKFHYFMDTPQRRVYTLIYLHLHNPL